jgi:hypothetical protein
MISIGGCRSLVLADPPPDDGGDPAAESRFTMSMIAGWQAGVTPLNWDGVDALVQQIQTLPLAEPPLVTEADLTGYEWDAQTISFTDVAAGRLFSLGISSALTQAVPIVVSVDDERIYLAVIWPIYWSSLPSSPMMTVFEANGGTPYHMDISAGNNPDNEALITDPRIYQAIWEAGLLN